jgi:hypothetical protein
MMRFGYFTIYAEQVGLTRRSSALENPREVLSEAECRRNLHTASGRILRRGIDDLYIRNTDV